MHRHLWMNKMNLFLQKIKRYWGLISAHIKNVMPWFLVRHTHLWFWIIGNFVVYKSYSALYDSWFFINSAVAFVLAQVSDIKHLPVKYKSYLTAVKVTLWILLVKLAYTLLWVTEVIKPNEFLSFLAMAIAALIAFIAYQWKSP